MELALKIRNVFLKMFVIALLILIAVHIFYFFNSDLVIRIFEYVYRIDPEDAILTIVMCYNIMKMVTVMFFLVPALAIHCEFSRCKCKVFEKEGDNVCDNE